MKKFLVAALAAWVALSAGAYADVPAISVRYGDLDLSRPAGAETALRRIERAADQVCGGMPTRRDFRRVRAHQACADQVIDETVARLGAPLVAARHEDRAPVHLASGAK
jgi:UrcA family protein